MTTKARNDCGSALGLHSYATQYNACTSMQNASRAPKKGKERQKKTQRALSAHSVFRNLCFCALKCESLYWLVIDVHSRESACISYVFDATMLRFFFLRGVRILSRFWTCLGWSPLHLPVLIIGFHPLPPYPVYHAPYFFFPHA